MGQVKNWLMEMEEDAIYMAKDEWADKHGLFNLDVWYTVNGEWFDPVFDIFD